MEKKLKVLIIDMEYTRDEINEPINIDIILDSIEAQTKEKIDLKVLYKKNGINSDYININDTFDLVLISSKISSYNSMKKIIQSIKTSKTIIGGVLATYEPIELALKFKNSIICIGECETNINQLIKLALHNPTTTQYKEALVNNNVNNICFYQDSIDNVYMSKRNVADISILTEPPIHNTLPQMVNGRGMIRMETSRGCPWNKCKFCVMPWRFSNTKWRQFSFEKIEKEIKYLICNGSKLIYFTDEDFVGDKSHIIQLCDIILKHQKYSNDKVNFGGSTSVWTLLRIGDDLDLCLRKMQDAGINRLFIGVESGSDTQLKRYNKGVSSKENEYIIKKLKNYNFVIDYGFILFDAETTMDELNENLNFIDRCGLRKNMSHFAKKLRIVPYTELFVKYSETGYIKSQIDLNENCYNYSFLDHNIQLICEYVDKINLYIGEESYQLQTQSRTSLKKEKKVLIENRLIELREIEFFFLKRCIELYYKNNKLTEELIHNEYQKIIGDLLK